MHPIYLLLEVGAASFFALAAWLALRRGRLPFLELISAAVFGLLLEEGDQLIFQTYHYADAWVLQLDRAPLVIGLTWALIIAGAMRITDALGVRRRWAPFVDSVLAISLDLAFDAIAIRMGLWTWRGVGPTDGWFGVPAGNFYAWLFVTWAFSYVSRWLRDAARGRPALEWAQLLVPVPAFVIFLFTLVPFSVVKPLIDSTTGGGLILFLIAFAGFIAAATWGIAGPDRGIPNGSTTAILDLRLAFITRMAIHGFFLVALLAIGLGAREPVILAVAVVLMAAELPLAVLVQRRRNPVGGRLPFEGAATEA
jgi:Carotenoid biosynthesis protein